ncbi:MAG: dihydroorotate dehydrogenase [Candidatus Komeilibacteria bacterium]|nr:dihydroorotate dehydrogenase [Candidatus Komeilibacteria bacterium]
MPANLETTITGLKLNNPTILASGVLGVTKASLKNVINNGAGAVTTKSISLEPRSGHKAPIIITYEAGMLNAVGYSNQGAVKAAEEFANSAEVGAPVIGSVIGQSVDDFIKVISKIKNCGFSAIEVPLSCPHTPGYGTLGGQHTPEMAKKITDAIKKISKLPLWIKVSPNENMIAVAKAAEAGGADAIVAGNSMGPGMIIDIKTAKPILGFGMGGVSGPALRPIAVRCVYDLYKAIKIPIIGCGGITYGRDLIEMMMAGATAVAVGTAVYYRGVSVFKKITEEAEQFLTENNYKDITQIIGLAHG